MSNGIQRVIGWFDDLNKRLPGCTLYVDEDGVLWKETMPGNNIVSTEQASKQEVTDVIKLALFFRAYMPDILMYQQKIHVAFTVMGIDPDELYRQAVEEADAEKAKCANTSQQS